MSKEFGQDCLVKDCEDGADRVVQDGDLMVSVCDDHADEVEADNQ